VGHSRFNPASLLFPFIPIPTRKRTRDTKTLRRHDPAARIAPVHTPSSSLRSQIELIMKPQSKGKKKEAKPSRRVAVSTAGLALL